MLFFSGLILPVSLDFVNFRPNFSGQNFFDVAPKTGRKLKAYSAIGADMAGNGDQFAGDSRFFKKFFRAQGVTYRFKERHSVRFLA